MLLRSLRREFELLVCGTPGIDVPFLRRHTRYDGIHPAHPVIGMFWDVLAKLTPMQQATVMRFMWARERLPPSDAAFTRPFIIARLPRDDPDSSLPQAHTCAFQVCCTQAVILSVCRCCCCCSYRGGSGGASGCVSPALELRGGTGTPQVTLCLFGCWCLRCSDRPSAVLDSHSTPSATAACCRELYRVRPRRWCEGIAALGRTLVFCACCFV
jgi:hypothetical protein